MPMNGYSIGSDATVNIISPSGPLRFLIHTGFTARQITSEQKVKRLDGIVDNLVFPEGWEGDFDFERQNSAIDEYFARFEANYYSGIDNGAISITQTIREPGGGLSQWRFVNVVMKFPEGGGWAGAATVKQKVNWMASRRLKGG